MRQRPHLHPTAGLSCQASDGFKTTFAPGCSNQYACSSAPRNSLAGPMLPQSRARGRHSADRQTAIPRANFKCDAALPDDALMTISFQTGLVSWSGRTCGPEQGHGPCSCTQLVHGGGSPLDAMVEQDWLAAVDDQTSAIVQGLHYYAIDRDEELLRSSASQRA